MIYLTKEQKSIRQEIRKLAEEKFAPFAGEIDETGQYPNELLDFFDEHDLLKLKLPEKYGGLEEEPVTYYLIIEEMARVCASSAMFIAVHGSCLTSINFGADEQLKDRILTKIGKGKYLMGWALTEPNAGSDVASMETLAVLDRDNYIINGTKCFISGGAGGKAADIYTVFVKTGTGKGKKNISAFVIEKGTPGFSAGKIENKLGLRGSQAVELIFKDVKIPMSNLIGKEGDGWQILMESIKETRLGVASIALGVAQGALDHATDYAKHRIQFGRPISQFQGIQFMLADMKMQVEASRALIYQAASMLERGEDDILPYASLAKCFASDAAMKVTTDAVQILGGAGYMKDYPVERMMRDAKSTQLMEGTSQIQKIIIAKHMLQ